MTKAPSDAPSGSISHGRAIGLTSIAAILGGAVVEAQQENTAVALLHQLQVKVRTEVSRSTAQPPPSPARTDSA